jgi:hypothetical protein
VGGASVLKTQLFTWSIGVFFLQRVQNDKYSASYNQKAVKETLTQEFRNLFFFHQTTPHRPLIGTPSGIWLQIREENRL